MEKTVKNTVKASGRFTPEQVQQFLQQGDIQTVADIQSALKDLFGQTLQAMLEGEMDHHVGYSKNDSLARQAQSVTNRRNGHGVKSVRCDYGDIALSVPRDREGSFEPLIVQKRQKTITGIEDQILALYAKGVSCACKPACAATFRIIWRICTASRYRRRSSATSRTKSCRRSRPGRAGLSRPCMR